MKYNQFKMMDLFVLSLLAFGSEFLGYFLVDKLETPFYLSFSFAICFIAMIRWGIIGVITYVVAGISLFVLKFDDATIVGSLFYEVVANAAICLPFLYYINKNRNDILKNMLRVVIVLMLCVLSLTIAKGLVLLIAENSLTGAIEYFGYSLLINLMNVVLLLLLVKSKSQLLTDMKIYLTESSQKQEEIENE